MKILFDHNLPWNLRKSLRDHDVKVAGKMGWAEIKNGQLLTLAEQAGFEVFLTADQEIRYQQNLDHRRIAILELTTNHWPSLQLYTPAIVKAVSEMTPGCYRVLECRYVYGSEKRSEQQTH